MGIHPLLWSAAVTKKVVRWSVVVCVIVLALTGGAAYAGTVGVDLKANDKAMTRYWTNAAGAKLLLREDGTFLGMDLGGCFGTVDRITRGELKPADLDFTRTTGTWYVDPANDRELSRMDLMIYQPKRVTLSIDITQTKWRYREITAKFSTQRSTAHPTLPDASCTMQAVKR
jgi:hypothetical protein